MDSVADETGIRADQMLEGLCHSELAEDEVATILERVKAYKRIIMQYQMAKANHTDLCQRLQRMKNEIEGARLGLFMAIRNVM